MMLARRPRWAMPMCTLGTPASETRCTTSSIIGMSASQPSSEKVFWPRYVRRRKRSNTSTDTSRSSAARRSSRGRRARTWPDSMNSRSHCRWSWLEMCSIS